jgi:hypothetical protein
MIGCWNDGMLDKACLSVQKAIFPFSFLQLLLERFNQFKKLIFNFVVELVELFVFLFRDLVGFHKSYARGMKLTTGTKGNVKIVEIFLEAATSVSFSDVS